MLRRCVVSAAGGVTLGAALPVFGQTPPKVWRVGFLSQRHLDFVDADTYYGPFVQGMREPGYVEGKNLHVEWRSAEGNIDRLPQLAAELVRLVPDVLVTGATAPAQAMQKATSTIPIVMMTLGDPIGSGLFTSLARPGGNSTGGSLMMADLGPKLLGTLHSVVPKARRVALLVNPANPSHVSGRQSILDAARKLEVIVQVMEAHTSVDTGKAFAAMKLQNSEALMIARDPMFSQEKVQITDLMARHRLPSISSNIEFVEAGSLLSYGPDRREGPYRAAAYVDKIFKGAKPGDLPVEQPTKFDLAINVKTAKVLGVKIPQSVLIQATKVFE